MCQVSLTICNACGNNKTHSVDLQHCYPVEKLFRKSEAVTSTFSIREGFGWSPLPGCDGLLIQPEIRSAACSGHQPSSSSARARETPMDRILRRNRHRRTARPANLAQSLLGTTASETASDSASDVASNATPEQSSTASPSANASSIFASNRTSNGTPRTTEDDDLPADRLQGSQTLGSGIQRRPGGLFTRTLSSGRIGRANYEINFSSESLEVLEGIPFAEAPDNSYAEPMDL